MKRNVEEDEMGLTESMSFPNLAFSAAFVTKSELLHEEVKHDFVKPEAITRSIAVSIMWTSLPRAIISPGLDLSLRR
jgi:hypothetical protein